MSWIVSLLLAGVMFTTESELAVKSHYNQTNSNVKKIIKFDETERFEQSYPLDANGRVSVSNINGSITVEAWDRNEVKLVAVKTADSRETLAEVELEIDARPDSFSIETDYTSWKNRDGGQRWKDKKLRVEFHLTVPRGANLNEIESVNGSITLSNFTNYTKASAVNGGVKAMNLRGTAILSTVNGTTEADFDSVQPNSKISLSTVNGSVNLFVPSDINATVKADTVNGSINNDFGLPVRKGQYVGRDLYGKIGSGDAQIRLESVNGGLSIKRKNDGRSPNPATNLLPPKGKDVDYDSDDDFDADRESSIESKKMNEHLEKAAKDKVVKNTHKKVTESVKQAEKELKKIQPEISRIAVETAEVTTKAVSEAMKAVSSEEVKAKLQEAQLRQREAFIRLRNARWEAPTMNEKSQGFQVKDNPTVTIDAQNCSVFVRGWDKPEVKYSVRQVSRFSAVQNQLDVKAEKTDSEVKIKVFDNSENGDLFNMGEGVRVEVFVPKKSNLRILSNREIRLEGVSGDVKLMGGSGAINVRDADGTLDVSSSEGRIRLIGFRGEVNAQSKCGLISLDGDFQKLYARSSDGNVILTLPNNANATLITNKGITVNDAEMDGSQVRIGNLDLMKEKANTWRVGKGGVKFNFELASGDLVIRNAADLLSN